MIVDVDARSDIGCALQTNEDMILVADEAVRDRSFAGRFEVDDESGKLLLAVADGMGGGAAGDVASEMAVGRIRDLVAAMPSDLQPDEVETVLKTWALETHAALLERSRRDSLGAGMGTTIVGLLICRGCVYQFHAGDSRLYRLRGGELRQLMTDHSLRQQSGDQSTPSNLLVNSLGGGASCWLDVKEVEGGVREFDRFLLCSDGLHDAVADRVIAGALAADRNTAVSTLIKLARGTQAGDNISALIADFSRVTVPGAIV